MHIDPGFPLTIGENCTIGHKVMLHGCTIGDNSLIGMGAIVLGGSKVGEGVATEGKTLRVRPATIPGKIRVSVKDPAGNLAARSIDVVR